MKAESTLRHELRKVKDTLNLPNVPLYEADMLYGALQALSWALGQDAAPPHVLGSGGETDG